MQVKALTLQSHVPPLTKLKNSICYSRF